MEYFKYTRAFLNSIEFEETDYTKLDSFLNGTVKGFLAGNYGFINPAPSDEELQELTNDLKACYSDMLLNVVPQYEEVLRLSTPTQYTNTDTTTSKYGDEEVTGKYFEPKLNSTQDEIKTTGQKTEWNDDEITVEREEYKTFNDNAVKDFFTDIKASVENYFVDFINPYADGSCEEFDKGFTEEQRDAINSGITAEKAEQIETNKNNISTIAGSISEIIDDVESLENRVSTNETNISNLDGRLDTAESDITSLKSRVTTNEGNITSLGTRTTTNETDISGLKSRVTTSETNITNLGNRLTTAENDIDSVGGEVDTINSKIPNQASAQDQLAPKSFVNSTVQTATANFRGNWLNWASVPIDPTEYPEDYTRVTTPSTNDYMVVQDASGYIDPEQTLSGTWRFKYSGIWSTDGRNGWRPEYQVNGTPMTQAQLDALNSGITTSLVGQISNNEQAIYDLQPRVSANEADILSLGGRLTNAESDISTAKTNITNLQNNKQNNLSATQLSAVNSGIDSTKVAQIETNKTNIGSHTTQLITLTNDVGTRAKRDLSNLQSINPTLTSTTETHAGKSGVKKTGGHFVVESWKSNDNLIWYRKWSDGFKECGGINSFSGGSRTVTTPLSFETTTYVVQVLPEHDSGYPTCQAYNKTANTFLCVQYGNQNYNFQWYACGY